MVATKSVKQSAMFGAAVVLVAATTLQSCKPRGQALADVASAAGCIPATRDGKLSVAALIANAANPQCATSFIPLPLVRQTKGFTCGAASLQSILSYWGDFYTEGVLQRILKSHKDNGTSWKRIQKFVHGLNGDSSRKAFDQISGFDEIVDLNELRTVLADRDIQEAIRRKVGTKVDFQKVLDGIAGLKTPDINIDTMSIAVPAAGLGLADPVAATPTPETEGGRRVVRPRRRQPAPGEYSTSATMGQIVYRGNGTLPTGCTASTYTAPRASQGAQTTGMTMAQLEEATRAGNPVLALTQAWTYDSDETYNVDTYAGGWDSGHYVVVIGMDVDNVYLMDPYTMGHYAFVPRAEFEKRWHDYDGNLNEQYERCPGGYELHHFGMVITRNTPDRHVPDRVTKMY